MARMRIGLSKVLEYWAQERRRRQIDVINAEADFSHMSQRLTAAERLLRDAEGLSNNAYDAAALQAAGRYLIHLRHSMERRQRLATAAVAHVARAKERLTAAARREATIERLLERRRQERDGERARIDRAMHDESAARIHARATRAGQS